MNKQLPDNQFYNQRKTYRIDKFFEPGRKSRQEHTHSIPKMDDNFQLPRFNSLNDECAYWKKKCHAYTQKLTEAKQEYNDFVENSRELEAELETTLEQREKTIRDLKSSLNQIQNDNESLRVSEDGIWMVE